MQILEGADHLAQQIGGDLGIERMTFCSSRCVAKLCRSVCMETRLSISAACAAAWTARLSCRVLSDSMGLRPGNSQPPSSILP